MPTPRLSYYFGRRVTEVRDGPEDEAHFWQIVLDPMVLIRNLDEGNAAPPPDIIGTALLTGSVEEGVSTTLQFGYSMPPTTDDPGGSVQTVSEVVFADKKYEIQDPEMNEDYVVPDDPVVAEDSLPADPSDDRVADGPTEPTPEEG